MSKERKPLALRFHEKILNHQDGAPQWPEGTGWDDAMDGGGILLTEQGPGLRVVLFTDRSALYDTGDGEIRAVSDASEMLEPLVEYVQAQLDARADAAQAFRDMNRNEPL